MNITDWFQRKVSALTLLMPLRPGSGLRGSYKSLAREGYMQNSVVHACVKEIAEAAAGVPWSLYQRKADGDLEEVPSHPLLKLLDRPNPFQGKFELVERCVAHLYLSGNAYKEARKALYTEVVLPVLSRLRDAFNNWLLPRFDETLFLDYDADRIDALSEDRDSLWRRAFRVRCNSASSITTMS